MKAKYNITRILILVLAPVLLNGCDQLPEEVKEWQQRQIQKRYGSGFDTDPEKIEEWQEDLKQYEEIIDEKVKAADQAARLHRKIGESYGEIEMYELCIEHLNEALKLGYHDPDVYYSLGLCQGSLAQAHNWDYNMTKAAEETFLKVLNLSAQYEPAKLQLGILYFYGFGSVLDYRVKSETITVTQKEFQQKAIELLIEYQFQVPEDLNSYFALGGIYTATGQIDPAIEQYRKVTQIIIELNPQTYESRPEYVQAMENLRILMVRQKNQTTTE